LRTHAPGPTFHQCCDWHRIPTSPGRERELCHLVHHLANPHVAAAQVLEHIDIPHFCGCIRFGAAATAVMLQIILAQAITQPLVATDRPGNPAAWRILGP